MRAYSIRLLLVGLVGFLVAVSVSSIRAEEKLTVNLSRALINTREALTVQAIVAPDAGNRVVGIQADSGEFFRSSEVEIDGENAPRVFELRLHDLPSGEYVVTVVLVNDKGERTTARKTFQVFSYGDDR